MSQPLTAFVLACVIAAVTGCGTAPSDDEVTVDLVLDGLPEETEPEPNERNPGAELPAYENCRTRLDLHVNAPSGSGVVQLKALGEPADSISFWDADFSWDADVQANRFALLEWPVGDHPKTVWVECPREGDLEFVLTFTPNEEIAVVSWSRVLFLAAFAIVGLLLVLYSVRRMRISGSEPRDAADSR